MYVTTSWLGSDQKSEYVYVRAHRLSLIRDSKYGQDAEINGLALADASFQLPLAKTTLLAHENISIFSHSMY